MICAINTRFVSAFGPVDPLNDAHEPFVVVKLFPTLLTLSNTVGVIPTNVTASGVPATNPSCTVNGIPADGSAFCKICGEVLFTTFATPSSSVFNTPN